MLAEIYLNVYLSLGFCKLIFKYKFYCERALSKLRLSFLKVFILKKCGGKKF
jgi:hypothetical protein